MPKRIKVATNVPITAPVIEPALKHSLSAMMKESSQLSFVVKIQVKTSVVVVIWCCGFTLQSNNTAIFLFHSKVFFKDTRVTWRKYASIM